MRAVKLSIGIATTVFVIAVSLYAPLCNLSCAMIERARATSLQPVESNKPSGHCHQSADSQKASSTTRHNTPAQHHHDDSGNCPGHQDEAALLRPAQSSPAALASSAQLVAIELPPARVLSLSDSKSIRDEGASFRSPPKRAAITVLRI